ncbi:MAG: fructose-6-phosphate aldolase [Nanoarchaeota archaeon]
MKLFIDSADVAEIKKYHDLGVVEGVTTNPSLLLKAGRNPHEVYHEIFRLIKGPISVETVKDDAAGMVADAEAFKQKFGEHMHVKIPMTAEGLKAVRQCARKGIKTNVTLVFSANQALLAAKAGATFISPFVGRLDDAGQDGMKVIQEIITVMKNYGFATQTLVASIRSPEHVEKAALLGAPTATIPPDVLGKLFQHPLTDAGIKKFKDDWANVKK